MKRALRRHHRQRRIQAEFKKWLRTWDGDREWALQTALRRHAQRQSCSCYMCGNARAVWGAQSRQENKAEQDHKEQFNDLGMRFNTRFRKEW